MIKRELEYWGVPFGIIVVYGILMWIDENTGFAFSPLLLLLIILWMIRGLYKKHPKDISNVWARLPIFTTGIYVVFLVFFYLAFFLYSHWWEERWFILFFAFTLFTNLPAWVITKLYVFYKKTLREQE